MEQKTKTWLCDIQNAIEEIYTFLPEKRDYYEFAHDVKTKKAVDRNLEIIGEALNRILKIDPDINISESRKIVDTRNRIIHGYDRVTPDILWLIINRSLPVLKQEIDAFLK